MKKAEFKQKITDLLEQRGPQKTACPSELLPPSQKKNKAKMAEVRQAALELARRGKIEIVQGGDLVDLTGWTGPIRLRLPQSLVPFVYQGVDFRKQPNRYRVARGEQGVLSVEPYKSELLPLWRFKTPDLAVQSVKDLLKKFFEYRRTKDFVGMDMTRKFLQMGFTRSRRYANHRSGKKYVGPVPVQLRGRSGAHGRKLAPRVEDPIKAQSAEIFRKAWQRVERNRDYARMKKRWARELG